ncbi:styrene monooxygenase/indole monooxygenase family protein [Mycobacterium sp.]|uniref:styrene monooxygenase/indole monooxygenase family protein n=1 Tax=Mycobacterium sp. TaxID=1785 RepID=UPI002CA8F246|nr:styrene monooxygenase/indole monooxygenase family protein [Mycobacterium sp.]HKP41781.1 styrene monooxygenase/indole monooxygenase family protein [Mycobacterium sp.]
MRTITIVGAGQSGLHLGIGLLDAGYDVRIVSNRTPEQIYNGRILSSQIMFVSALAREAALGLDFWSKDCPTVDGVEFSLPDGNGGKAISWASRLDLPAQSVDQRVKMPRWMAEFTSRGGRLDIQEVTIDDLEKYAKSSELVLVAAGKGDMAQLFERDAARSTFDAPQRALSLTYVTGMTPTTPYSTVSFNLIPGAGEYFVMPALTTTGPCDIMAIAGLPGGPLDLFGGVTDAAQHFEIARKIVDTYVPWEAERCRDVQLTDNLGVLAGRLTPTVRKPIGVLPSGAPVLGLADVVVLNDPITGQGSNNASKCATSYLSSILEHGDRPFDTEFMTDTFERYWDYAKYAAAWTNSLLMQPPPHVVEILAAAGTSPRIARRFANGYDDPRDFFHWFMDPDAARSYLDELAPAEGAGSGLKP